MNLKPDVLLIRRKCTFENMRTRDTKNNMYSTMYNRCTVEGVTVLSNQVVDRNTRQTYSRCVLYIIKRRLSSWVHSPGSVRYAANRIDHQFGTPAICLHRMTKYAIALQLTRTGAVGMGGTRGTHGIPRYQISRYQYRGGHGIPWRSRYFTVLFRNAML